MKPISVLIVDDEEELAFTLAERLGLRGFEAEGVTSGEEALDRIRKTGFDAVVLDVKMPGLGGIGVIRQMKSLRPAMPVVMITGHGCRESAEEGMQAGACRYLMKPVQIDSLVQIIREAVQATDAQP
jgi:DNA-binding NtrC family response regulator